MASREAIYQALYDRLVARIDLCRFFSRRYLEFQRCPAQPALICVATDSASTPRPGFPAVLTLNALLIIYAQPPESALATAETTLFAIIDQIEAALLRDPSESSGFGSSVVGQPHTTLGGLVHRAWIPPGASIETYSGEGGEQAVALISVEMTAAT
jgi:hypothetical protein